MAEKSDNQSATGPPPTKQRKKTYESKVDPQSACSSYDDQIQTPPTNDDVTNAGGAAVETTPTSELPGSSKLNVSSFVTISTHHYIYIIYIYTYTTQYINIYTYTIQYIYTYTKEAGWYSGRVCTGQYLRYIYYIGPFKIQLHINPIASVCYLAIILACAADHLIRLGLHNCFDRSIKHFGPFEPGRVDSILTLSAGILDDDVYSLF